MTKPIIIFGNKDLAEMAKWYWQTNAVGFTMDNPESDTFLGFPMYDFETNMSPACCYIDLST